ncbi:uncharacterized protein LOC113202093 isoform X5 [Frankliniella occidentalis]|uniref:Uncharacterized protein LOC113202093 isoform X5 n=1 Tax=Frankliniella occidentalis TaxID=133901 RepID=A0A6J1RZE4_FRAOC|nr:uncharacterized protein LOC113202093 isoform X5 [Frankliniella occidentalis]
MADNNSALGPLPNGWECRHDPRTRRNYYINFINKTTTWDDPRAHAPIVHAPPPYQEPAQLLNMQPQLHGTPDHRNIYPSSPAPYHPQPAFHLPSPYIQEILRQDISSFRPSPVPGRAHTAPLMGSHAIGHHSSSKLQETSFSTAVATENSVAKISAMFPTVSETHIRALLIKYMKSMFPKADETVILDTLYNVDNNVQAATSQLQAMGFDKRDTTPSHAGTPSSKMKVTDKNMTEKEKDKVTSTPTTSARLRSVEEKQGMRDRIKKTYPDLAEQVILMALDSVDYDEKKADLILKTMIKEDTPKSTQPSSACSSQRPQSNKSEDADASSLGTKTTIEADVITHSNKKGSFDHNKSSVEEDLKITQNFPATEDIALKTEGSSTLQKSVGDCGPTSKSILTTNATVHLSPKKAASSKYSAQPLSMKTSIKKTKGKKDVPKVSRGTSTTEDKEYRSAYRITTTGPNPGFHHGPNDELLIEDYVTWAGPNRSSEHASMAKGPNKALLSCQQTAARGPNRDACKGPQKGLSKGSLYSRLAACNAAATLLVVESRGK